MTTFVQILEGPSLEKATVIAQVQEPAAVQVVKDALAAWLANGRFVQRPARRKRDWQSELGGLTLQEWCDKRGLSYSALTSRMKRGESFEEAVQKLSRR